MKIFAKRVGFFEAPLPKYQTSGSAGCDLHAAIEKEAVLAPSWRVLVPTGLALAIPYGWEAQVRPRSSLAQNYGVTVLNAPGTIDSDYRGEIKVLLVNHGHEDFVLKPGDRIAQLVFAQVHQVTFDVVDELEKTERGEGGFGSTGAT